jgi:hypothetical protein
MDYLCEMTRDKARCEALEHLPPTLFATYERILDRVNNTHNENVKTLVERSLRWIVNGTTESGTIPSSDAIVEAISVNMEDASREESAIPEEVDILRWCSSLVRKTAGGKSIEIAHFTVEEFLCEIGPAANPSLARYRQIGKIAYTEMAKTSLVYLSFTYFIVTNPEDFLRVTDFPFWKYVAQEWILYYQKAQIADLELKALIRQFFDASIEAQFITWTRYLIWKRDLFETAYTMPTCFFDSVREKNIPENIRPLVVAIGTFCDSTTQQALDFPGTGRHALLDDFRVLEGELRIAAQFGHVHNAERLLAYNKGLLELANTDDGKTALHMACENGHCEISKSSSTMAPMLIHRPTMETPLFNSSSCPAKIWTL